MPLTELADRPPTGRIYTDTVRTGIGDAAPTGRIRLDAIARWLQDAAYWDLVDAGWEQPAWWLVRKLRIRAVRFPEFGARLELATWCSGLGHSVAERRTTITGDDGAHIEAVGQWIHFDHETERPVALPERFLDVYAPAAMGRRTRTKLKQPEPPSDAAARDFVFRASDVDQAEHVNNAAYWAVLEEELGDRPATGGIDVEVEHRSALLAGSARVLSAEGGRWVLDGAGDVVASFAFG
jgi:acyl-ACP thioesterase